MTSAGTPVRPALAGTPLERSASGLDLCVHCGICMQACPTYLVLEDENDSPRGRLMLMRGAVEGDLDITDPALTSHIDRCLRRLCAQRAYGPDYHQRHRGVRSGVRKNKVQ